MPIIQPDTSAQLDMGPIAPGTYRAQIKEVSFETSKKGNPMIVPNFEVSVPGVEQPRPRKSYLVVTGAGSYGFDQLMRACGYSDEADAFKNPNVQPKPAFDTDLLVGKAVNVVIQEELDDKGNKRDSIKSYLPL